MGAADRAAPRGTRPPRSSSAGAVRGSSPGASRSLARRSSGSATSRTGAGPSRASAIRTARILLIGLAPAAHGGNRTGRVFTGDASGDFLWAALHAVGLADRPASRRADDGLTLTDTYIAAAVRCAPPLNKPTNVERDTCAPFLRREMALLPNLRVIVALGQFGWDAALRALADLGHPARPKPRFGHGAEVAVGPYVLLGTYHPSQQNTFTGKLTAPMFEAVLSRARVLATERSPASG